MIEVVTTDEFAAWYHALSESHQTAVMRIVDLLEALGTKLGFPYCSDLKGTELPLRELRVKTKGSQIRIAYAFDPKRQAVLILAGDKTGNDRFYEWLIPAAEKLWQQYLKEQAPQKDKRGRP